MKYGMRERISGGVIIVAIAVILVLFFFGRPGHRDENATAPEVSFNQQPVVPGGQNADPHALTPIPQTSQAPDLSQVNGGNNAPASVATSQNKNLNPLPADQEHPSAPSSASAGLATQPVAPIQTQSFALSPAQQHLAPVTSHGQPPAPIARTPAPLHLAPKSAAHKSTALNSEKKRAPVSTSSNDPVIGAATAHAVTAHPAASKHPTSTSSSLAPTEGWSVQAGSFSNVDNAHRLRQRLSQRGFKAYSLKRDANTVVLVGPFSSSQIAEETRTQMQQRTGTNGLVVRNGRH